MTETSTTTGLQFDNLIREMYDLMGRGAVSEARKLVATAPREAEGTERLQQAYLALRRQPRQDSIARERKGILNQLR